jgi:plasmid maintenance system antidote protein VapI
MVSKIVKAGFGALVMTTALSSPAHALFGPTCIPTLYNCNCTYIKPCPVVDTAKTAKLALENSKLAEALQLMKDLKDPKAFLIKSISGQGTFGIPGLDSIGIDIAGIANGDLSSLGLPPGITALADNLTAVGIDLDMVVAMANGELTPGDFIKVATAAGVDFSALEAAGIDQNTLISLANGDISADTVLGIATNLGVQGNVLTNLGISEDLIQDIASGNVDPQRLLTIAQNAGLDMSALEQAGLTAESITQIANGASPEVLMGMLQSAGYDQSPITALGLDATTLGSIASGALPPSAINNLVQGTGIDPKSIVIPGPNGAISLTGGASSGTSGGAAAGSTPTRPTNREDMISIPIDSVPGLQNVINTARGITPSGPSTPASSATAALCSAEQSLIAVGVSPNGYGDDVATIDAALSPGDINQHLEAIEDGVALASETYAFGAARSIHMRPILKAALEAVDSFDTMMKDAKTIEDDRAINHTIKKQVMVANAEVASMMTALLSVKAAQQINENWVTPVPLLPHDSQWEASVRQNITGPNEQRMETARAATEASTDFSRLQADATEAVYHHNLLVDAASIESTLPTLIETIEFHEEHKAFLVTLEQIIKNGLDDLYVGGSAATWPRLQAALNSNFGSYVSPSKWDEGMSKAQSLSAQVAANAPATPYGVRKMLSPATREMPATFSSTGETPYHYPAAATLSRGYDPYAIIDRSTLVIPDREGGGTIPAGMQFVGVFQNYLETLRRLEYYGQIRRAVSMTSDFWNEMVHAATDCMAGPIPTTAENIAERPDLFDLSPYCQHIEWSGGDPGDYIDASEVGGTDSALWLSKISIDRVNNRTGGQASVKQRAQELIDNARATQIATRLTASGNQNSADKVQPLLDVLNAIVREEGLQQKFVMP